MEEYEDTPEEYEEDSVNANTYDHLDMEAAAYKKKALTRCDYCDKQNAKIKCDECHEARYCSEDCQTDDRPHHELICASAKKFNDSTRPADHIRAIKFSIDSAVPSFLWLDTKMWPSSVAEAFCMDSMDELNPPEDINMCLWNRQLAHGILQYGDSNVMSEELQQLSPSEALQRFNRSIAKLARPSLLPFHYSNYIYCGFVPGPPGGDPITVQDASMKDFRAVVDWLVTFAADASIPNFHRYPGKWYSKYRHDDWRLWPAVKVNCEADLQRLSSMTTAGTWPVVEDLLTMNAPPSNSEQPPVLLAQLAGLP
ncbi:hypothetical protein F4821DRAFT_247466 [Hypoxylon rubiginosum]|uniref:Uncharacterized protein n=1 Tax=Hypoxylon rubiginosum TaxID=110542 RepID=A0ACC0CPB1_9PEZI|nr:hypothetical protein F4821DRAFT_247466 [Hypoxylon rubiginosum]